MGNGIKKVYDIVSPPSSPAPQTSRNVEAATPGSSAKKRRRSSKKNRRSSPDQKVSSGRKETVPNKDLHTTTIEDEFGTPKMSSIPSPKKRRRSTENTSSTLTPKKSPAKKAKRKKDSIAPIEISPATVISKKKTDNSATMDTFVHRLRHLDYIPGSISALTPMSTEDGQIVLARTDGSYELKSISSLSITHHQSSDDIKAPRHRLITIAETTQITGHKSVLENLDENSSMEGDSNHGVPEPSPDAATSLCWVYSSSTPICIGSGPNGNIWIVDFKKSRPINAISSGGGGIFDLSACEFSGDCSGGKKSLPLVAGACEDGSVRIWRVILRSNGEGKIQDPPLVTLPSAGAPVLSLAWRNVSALKQGRTESFQTVIFAAIADGTIRKYGLEIEKQSSSIAESNSGNSSDKILDSHNIYFTIPNPPKSILRMTVENKGRKDPTKVWTLLLLQDNTLVAGTSLGQVQFWNGETGTLTQTVIQSNAQADVLKIVVNSDETKLFCSGVDSRVLCLERRKLPVPTSAQEFESELSALVTSHINAYRPWKMTISQRPHTHDVKAMAIVTSSSKAISKSVETLLTGGLDTKICSYSVSSFAHTQPQTWYPWPSATSLFSSTTRVPNSNPALFSMQRSDRIELYQLENLAIKRKRNRPKYYLKNDITQYPTSIPVGTIQLGDPNDGYDDDINERIVSSSSSPLQTSALSPNGKFLAVSNASSTYVFCLKITAGETNENKSVQLQPVKLQLPERIENVSASTFLFTSNELYIGDSSGSPKVHVLCLPSQKNDEGDDNSMDMNEEDVVTLDVQTVSLPDVQQLQDIMLPIQSIHADGEFMVTSCHARENATHIFRRRNSKASFEHFWTLPSLGGDAGDRPAAVTLLDKKRLAVATYRSHLYVLDIETRSLNKWSEQYGFPIRKKKWTVDSLCGRGYPLRLLPQQNDRLIMTSFGSFCIIDLNKPMPRHCRAVPKRPVCKNRRKCKPIVHDDSDDDEDHWLEPRVTTVVEDEYSSDDDEDDASEETNHARTLLSNSSSNKTTVSQEITDAETSSQNCTICSHYKDMLYTDFLGPREMIIVEQPWSKIAETFPAALQRRIYGAD